MISLVIKVSLGEEREKIKVERGIIELRRGKGGTG